MLGKLVGLRKTVYSGKRWGVKQVLLWMRQQDWEVIPYYLPGWGFNVIAIERVPVISALLEDGITRAKSIEQRLQIQHHFCDAKDLLPKLSTRPDSIYLDPMYPEGRKKSVEVARPLKILRELVGDDLDFAELLQVALNSTAKRVIVKRPIYADPLYLRELAGSLKGKMVRYDIYIRMT